MNHPPYRVVPARSLTVAPSRFLDDEAAARLVAATLASRYGTRFDLWRVNPSTGRGVLLATFEPNR